MWIYREHVYRCEMTETDASILHWRQAVWTLYPIRRTSFLDQSENDVKSPLLAGFFDSGFQWRLSPRPFSPIFGLCSAGGLPFPGAVPICQPSFNEPSLGPAQVGSFAWTIPVQDLEAS